MSEKTDNDICVGLVVGFNFNGKTGNSLLIVGRQKNSSGKVDVINAFEGDEAYHIYKKLTECKLDSSSSA